MWLGGRIEKGQKKNIFSKKTNVRGDKEDETQLEENAYLPFVGIEKTIRIIDAGALGGRLKSTTTPVQCGWL
jgi:hypothetical protein